jgi:hypothetical protein
METLGGILGILFVLLLFFSIISDFVYEIYETGTLSYYKISFLCFIFLPIIVNFVIEKRKQIKERKFNKYVEENSCPICNKTGVLNGFDSHTDITFEKETCYSCEGLKYSNNSNEQIIYKIIKECNLDNESKRTNIRKLSEYLNKINEELKKAEKILQSTAYDSLTKSKEITERDIKYNESKINQNEVIKKKLIPILYNLHIFRVISKGSSENNLIDTVSDYKSGYVVTEKTKSIADSIFEEMNALSNYLNDKTETTDEFLKQIEALTSELKKSIN